MRGLVAVAILTVGCGDDPARHVPDAAVQPDGAIEIDAALPSPVTLTVKLGGAPQPGIHVYFLNPDSSVASAMPTDIAGVASAVLPTDSYVVAFDPLGLEGKGAHAVWTFAGVKPGDHLQIHDATPLDTSAITINVTLPVDATIGVAHYLMASSCSGPTEIVAQPTLGVPAGVSMYGCNGVADILIYTTDANGALLSSFYVPNQTVFDGQALDLTAHSYTAIATRTYTFGNHPGGNANPVFFNDTVASMRGPIFTSPALAAAGNPAVVQTAMPAFTGALDVVRSDFNNNTYSRHHFVDWGPYATTFELNLGNRILPDYATNPAFDPATRSVAWTESGSTNVPDLVYARLFASRSSPNQYWFTNFVGPRTGASIALPTLPTDLADYNITATDNTSLEVLYNAKVPGGYDAVRAEVLSVLWSDSGFAKFASAGTGSVSYVEIGPPPPLTRTAKPVMATQRARSLQPRH